MNTKKHEKQGFTQYELSKVLFTSGFYSRTKLTPSTRQVLNVLCCHYPKMYPSLKTIMYEAGIASKSTVVSAIKELGVNGFVVYETKNVNNYTFTNHFFEFLNFVPEQVKDYTPSGTNIEPKQISEKINKKDFSFNSNKPKGMDYPPAKIFEFKRDNRTPKNDYETALKFLDNLKGLENNFAIKPQIEEIKKIWNIS